LVHYWYSLGRPVTIGTVMVKHSQKQPRDSQNRKKSLLLYQLSCLLRVRPIHKAVAMAQQISPHALLHGAGTWRIMASEVSK